jgi:carbon monoxide dehydrogenase subunit G
MAIITSETNVDVGAEKAWALLRDPGSAAEAFPGVLVASRLDGDVRTVTFANGMAVQERIVSIDETRRRIAYAVIEGRFSHHSASMQIIPDGPERSRFVWISDFLPDDREAVVRPLVEQGTEAFLRAIGEGR